MSQKEQANYWVFSNKHDGAYDGSIWDMSVILDNQQYSIKEKEANRSHIRGGDIVYMRIYNQSFIGKFIVKGEWKPAPKGKQTSSDVVGLFSMNNMELWSRPVPQQLILGELSNQNYRRRIVKISSEDGLKIDTIQRVYEKLGFGEAEGEIVILEKGLEEAIKPNLNQLGLKLAEKTIQQQFSMGVGVGRSDLICVDGKGDLVVLELKRGMTSDATIGQVLRYVGWINENIAKNGQKVKGWIIAGDYDEHLRLAASAANIKIVLVRLG
jgi:hypothetical protein